MKIYNNIFLNLFKSFDNRFNWCDNICYYTELNSDLINELKFNTFISIDVYVEKYDEESIFG